MATIFRPPLYTRIWAREWDRALNSQPARGSSTALLLPSVVTSPLLNNQTEWPNPQIPRFSVALRTWLSPSTYQLISLGPVTGFMSVDGATDQRRVQQFEHVRNAALLAPQAAAPFANLNQPNPHILTNRAAWAYSVTQRNMQTQPPNTGAPLTAGNFITQGNPVVIPFSPANRGFISGLSAIQITPPPVGGIAKASYLYIGMRIGL